MIILLQNLEEQKYVTQTPLQELLDLNKIVQCHTACKHYIIKYITVWYTQILLYERMSHIVSVQGGIPKGLLLS